MPAVTSTPMASDGGPYHWWSLPRLWLERLEAWHRCRASVQTVCNHSFLTRPLSAGTMVLDAGAHAGNFGSFLHGSYGCQVTMIEPVAERLRVDEENGLRVVVAALSAQAGPRQLFLSRNPEASSFYQTIAQVYCVVGVREVETCTLEGALRDYCPGGAALVKLDIEGEEVPALLAAAPPVLASIGQLTVEFHDFLEDRPRRAEVRAVLRRLRQLGFLVFVMSRARGSHDDTLLVNKKLVRLSMSERAHLWLLTRVTLVGQYVRHSFAVKVRELIGRRGP